MNLCILNSFNCFERGGIMSLHSYSRMWIHLIWATHKRQKNINQAARSKLSEYLYEYSNEKRIYMKINFVNTEHVHALIDLPTNKTVEDVMHLIKGASSNWMNKNKFIGSNFAWGRGYGAFSVSQSGIDSVCKYISEQEEHHKKKTFSEEYEEFIKKYGLTLNR